jgi:hypothetical protein
MKRYTPNEKWEIIQFVNQRGNISEACKQKGISRSQVNEWLRLYYLAGDDRDGQLAALEDRTKTKPGAPCNDQKIIQLIRQVCLNDPMGSYRFYTTKPEIVKISLSRTTIQKILHGLNLGTREKRFMAIEKEVLNDGYQPKQDAVRACEKYDPPFRERASRSETIGNTWAIDILAIGEINLDNKFLPVYLEVAIDTFSSYVLGQLSLSKSFQGIKLLQERVIPFLLEHQLQMATIYTGYHTGCAIEKYKGRDNALHPFPTFLRFLETASGDVGNIIQERNSNTTSKIDQKILFGKTRHAENQSNGFLEAFGSRVQKDFVVLLSNRTEIPSNLIEMQSVYEKWEAGYNDISIQGFPNYGQSPVQMIGFSPSDTNQV